MPPIKKQFPILSSIIVVGGANDAPGFRLVPDGKGGWKIEKVPGWNPEQMAELGTALQLAATASRVKHEETSQKLVSIAASLANTELARAGIADAAGKGGTVVVVVG